MTKYTLNGKDLSAYFKIIKQSVADSDDPEQARPAIEAITPATSHDNRAAENALNNKKSPKLEQQEYQRDKQIKIYENYDRV